MTDNRDDQGLQQQPGDAQRQQAGQQNQQGERQPQQQTENPQQPQPGQQNQQADRDRQGAGVEQVDDEDEGSLGGGNGDLRPGRTGDGGAER